VNAPAEASKPLRVDAQRNFDAIVRAAGDAFAASGTGASLDDIAIAAAVGNATLYRHFPTRDSLLVEALRFEFSEIDAIARELAGGPDAAVALTSWVTQLATQLRLWRGLPASIVQALDSDASPLKAACQPLRLRTQMFLEKAQDAGVARAEVSAADLFALTVMLAWGTDQFGEGDEGTARLAGILFEGVARP
jgi:AcrR family transcriptional regulator